MTTWQCASTKESKKYESPSLSVLSRSEKVARSPKEKSASVLDEANLGRSINDIRAHETDCNIWKWNEIESGSTNRMRRPSLNKKL